MDLPRPSVNSDDMESLGLRVPQVSPPVSSNSVLGFDPEIVRNDAQGTRIVVHARFPELVQAFLAHKRKHGSPAEKDLYKEPWTWSQQVSRLIEKRPLVFMGSSDYTVLRDGTGLPGISTKEWDRLGSQDENDNAHLSLKEYLSYDEIMLGSLVGVSGPSFFINDGNRYNQAVPARPGTFEPRGIIVGLVGARFEREDRMDSVHILPSVKEPRQHPELSKAFQDYFGPTKQAEVRFDATMYKARIRIPIEILLLEATDRASDADRRAYVHVVGLGLGVWQRVREQSQYYVEAFLDAILDLGERLTPIGTLEFAWISVSDDLQRRLKAAAAGLDMRVKFSKRSPAEKLGESEKDQLLVVSYAWDGNAFPGNEYWVGSLCASGDPAAASMSTIGELHNPQVNPGYLQRIKVLS